MKVIAYDPYLSADRAIRLGVEKVELDELWRRADIITLHTPLTESTRDIINAKTLGLMKKVVRVVNCARGELIDEALCATRSSPAMSPVQRSTFSAKSRRRRAACSACRMPSVRLISAPRPWRCKIVALQVAEQMADYLLRGAISNAVNFPRSTPKKRRKAQAFHRACREARVFRGPADRNRRPARPDRLPAASRRPIQRRLLAAIAGLLRPTLQIDRCRVRSDLRQNRGIVVEEAKRAAKAITGPDYVDESSPIAVAPRLRHVFAGTDGHASSTLRASRSTRVRPSTIYIANSTKPALSAISPGRSAMSVH